MKIVKKLKEHNEVLRKVIRDFKPSKEQRVDALKKLKRNNIKQIILNNKCIQSIQSGISEENLIKQLDEITVKLNLIESKYEEWKRNTIPKEWGKDPVSTYRRINNITVMKNQINFLNYLLY